MPQVTAIFEMSEGAEAAAVELQRMGLSAEQVRSTVREDDPAQAGQSGSDTRPVALHDVARPVNGRYWLEVDGDGLSMSAIVDVLQRHGGHIH
ncbi:hypothetical protein [Deinococcus peraridilitoris]|uniref:hypothetical protein n=1 Tax=Deinococcus peraridilitoris TaxID=432329 RepID=UPI00059BBC3F|nr:hypothetical protein [Deinococcus peraridilitoris]